MQISQDMVVSIHYTLTDKAGETIDSSVEHGEPLAYLHGHGNIVPGLENALTGKTIGDKFDVSVQPADGYGEHYAELVQQVPREAFEGVDHLEAGMQFQADTGMGRQTDLQARGRAADRAAEAAHIAQIIGFGLQNGPVLEGDRQRGAVGACQAARGL